MRVDWWEPRKEGSSVDGGSFGRGIFGMCWGDLIG
jgi:hypothetical protein